MRVVDHADEFAERLEEARREAGAAFGNDAVFLERFVRHARHIEVQILGDAHGQHPPPLRARLLRAAPPSEGGRGRARGRARSRDSRRSSEAAVKLARAAGYYNAGTVEFLVDADSGEWYFIEVNPRIQVEHTVTEMVTGIDLVRSQIQIAQGHCAARRRDEAARAGEDSALRLRPAVPHHHRGPGQQFRARLRQDFHLPLPGGFGIRLDGGIGASAARSSLLITTRCW